MVEIKPIPTIWFEKCCLEALKKINGILKSGDFLGNILLPSKLFLLLAYPLGTPQIAGIVSTTVGLYGIDPRKIGADDWTLLAKDILAIPEFTRKSVFKVAQQETFKHLKENKQGLRLFWEGVVDAFA